MKFFIEKARLDRVFIDYWMDICLLVSFTLKSDYKRNQASTGLGLPDVWNGWQPNILRLMAKFSQLEKIYKELHFG